MPSERSNVFIRAGSSSRLPEKIAAYSTLCADEIEFWPPDTQPVRGRTAVLAHFAGGTTRIHGIEISDRCIRGSGEIAYLTASYKTTFSSAEDSTPRKALGCHLWILQKRSGSWLVTLVSWSLWRSAGSGSVYDIGGVPFWSL